MSLLRVVFFLVGLVCGTVGWAATTQDVTVGPAPAWVTPIDSETVNVPAATPVEDGVDYVLIDRQQTMEPTASFSHFTRRLTNEHGVQNGSEIRASYDPNYQTFVMHWMKVKRDGVWQDRIATEKLQVIQREENLDSQMLDGRLSIICHLQDVRVGDVIDFAYTVAGANPVFNDKFLFDFSATWANPVHLFSNQLITAPGRTVNVKSYGNNQVEPTRTPNPDQSERLVWKGTEVPATFAESNTPNWYDIYGWVQVSEFNSWKEVADWGLATFPFDAPLSPELQGKLADISESCVSPEDKALAVLAFVQDDIRYLGIEMGANSYKPTPPSLVCEHLFGDCKDKALLSVVMLRALGIEAYPAMVNTDYRQEVDKMLPSPLDFNHAIIQLTIDNRTYWVDPTRSGQRGRLKNFYVDDYKRALLVKSGTDALVSMETSSESLPTEKLEETFTVKSMTDPVSFGIHSIFNGRSADSLRSSFAESSREKIEKDYLDYYANHYSKIKVSKPLRFKDFPEDNRFEVWEEYQINDLWTRETPDSKWKASFTPQSVSDALGSAPSPQRTEPYELDFPKEIEEDIDVRMFEKWNVDSKPNDVATPYFIFNDHPSVDDKTVSFKYHFKTLVGAVLPAQMGDYHDRIEKIKDTLSYNLTYLPEKPAPPPPPPEPYRPNWTVIAIAAMFFGVSCYLAFRLFALPRLVPPLPLNLELTPYQGIGGWLILSLIGLIYRTGFYLKSLCTDYTVAWDATQWNVLTVPGSKSYDPLWAPSLLVELGFTILFAVLTITAIVLLFQKRAIFPKVMIALFVLTLLFKIIDNVMVNQIPYMVKLQDGKMDSNLIQVFVQSVIWIPYFLVSKRVKATFRF